jgi:gluconate 5-dehydrogenase
MFSLKGQVAVVTGGGRGIGRGICIGFAKAGADVVLVARTAADIAEVAEQVGALGQQALPIVADVTKREDAERVTEETIGRFGRVDILVNNAGGARFLSDPENIREDGWDKGVNLNLKSVFLFSQAIGRAMIEQGRGKIINVTSVTGIDPATGGEIAYYAAAKAGANALTRALATAWAPKGIYVNAIAAERGERSSDYPLKTPPFILNISLPMDQGAENRRIWFHWRYFWHHPHPTLSRVRLLALVRLRASEPWDRDLQQSI